MTPVARAVFVSPVLLGDGTPVQSIGRSTPYPSYPAYTVGIGIQINAPDKWSWFVVVPWANVQEYMVSVEDDRQELARLVLELREEAKRAESEEGET